MVPNDEPPARAGGAGRTEVPRRLLSVGVAGHQDDDVQAVEQHGAVADDVEGQPEEILEWTDSAVYYYISKRKKKKLKLLVGNQLKHWMYTQWQSGDVWDYAPYLTKLERDMLVYGNAQWTQLDDHYDNEEVDSSRPDWYL